jgi:hypothetical protein
VAVAQNLLPLVVDGCLLFHDFPGDGFNIDHVVVAPQAVFAVETKSRRKPASGGRDSAKVVNDGRALRFPEHFDTRSIDQARRQARWLEKYLANSAGDPVPVVPVLALPGWFVEATREGSQGDVIVSNLRTPRFLLDWYVPRPMAPPLFRRVAHALASRYPGIE